MLQTTATAGMQKPQTKLENVISNLERSSETLYKHIRAAEALDEKLEEASAEVTPDMEDGGNPPLRPGLLQKLDAIDAAFRKANLRLSELLDRLNAVI